MTDYYAILGVPRTATNLEIREAYLKLARDSHPDKVKDREERKKAEEIFKSVTAAYDTLSKERSRRDYTAKLPSTGETQVASRAGAPQSGWTPAQTSTAASGSRGSADLLAQGIEAFRQKDYHTAVQLLTIVTTQDEKNARAHAILGLALAKNPNWMRDALQHMETASRLEPKNVSYLSELAILLQSQGLKLRAKRALETAISLKPDHPDVARAQKEIPISPPEPEISARATPETPRGLFDRFRKR